MSASEAATGQGTQLSASLQNGLKVISQDQHITFTLYKQLINTFDGTVFWVRADLVTPAPTLPLTLSVAGSLHYDSNQGQQEDETIAVQKVLFTTTVEIAPFNDVEATTMYIGEFQGLEFSFTARRMFYQQAGLYHYYGDAVYPAMQSQLIKSAGALVDQTQVVSNSLPIWLAQNAVMPVYPSYLVPTNLKPPYAVAHVNQASQEALQAYPHLDATSSHFQLVKETVKIVIYGLRNNKALDYLDYVLKNSVYDETFGVLNMPMVQDEKRTQSELNILGMKKVIRFDISYYQTVARNIARQLITSATVTYYDQYGNPFAAA